jgi:hypothetical protein
MGIAVKTSGRCRVLEGFVLYKSLENEYGDFVICVWRHQYIAY